MKKHRYMTLTALVLGIAVLASCGGGNKGNKAGEAEAVPAEETTGTAQEQPRSTEKKQEAKAPAKKWYEQDFTMTYKQYVLTASAVRHYARKGNVVAANAEGSSKWNLYVFTDSTRTEYIVNQANGLYAKGNVKTGLSSVDEGIKAWLKSQMGDNIFSVLKPDGKNCTARDTTIFGRPAWVIKEEKTTQTFGVEIFTRIIEWVDKENSLPYYKYGFGKNGDKVITDAKAFEITDFSAKPTYEGFVVSLDGLTEVTK